MGLRVVALPESREESVCQLQPRPLQSPSLTLGCQRCGGNGAAAPVSDVMLRSSFSAPLPSSVEDAAAIAAEQQRSGSASLAALGAFGGQADPLCKCKVTARLQEDVCDTAGVSDSRWVQAVGLHLNMSRQNPPPADCEPGNTVQGVLSWKQSEQKADGSLFSREQDSQ